MSQGSVGKCDIKRRSPKDRDDKTPFGIFQSAYRTEVAGCGVMQDVNVRVLYP